MLCEAKSKFVALTMLSVFVVSACHSQDYSDMVGEWNSNHEDYGERRLFLYEDSTLALQADAGFYVRKLHQADGSLVQLRIDGQQVKVRYQSPRGSTVLWAVIDEALIELRPLSPNNIEMKALKHESYDKQTGKLTTRETNKSTPIVFQRSTLPISETYIQFLRTNDGFPKPRQLTSGKEALGVSWQKEPINLTVDGKEVLGWRDGYKINECTNMNYVNDIVAVVYPQTRNNKYKLIEIKGTSDESEKLCKYYITASGKIIVEGNPERDPYYRFWSPDERYYLFIEGFSSEYRVSRRFVSK